VAVTDQPSATLRKFVGWPWSGRSRPAAGQHSGLRVHRAGPRLGQREVRAAGGAAHIPRVARANSRSSPPVPASLPRWRRPAAAAPRRPPRPTRSGRALRQTLSQTFSATGAPLQLAAHQGVVIPADALSPGGAVGLAMHAHRLLVPCARLEASGRARLGSRSS